MAIKRKVIFRLATSPISLNILLKDQLNFLNKFFKIIAVSSPGDDLSRVKNREYVEINSVGFKRKISPFYDLICLINLVAVFQKNKPTIIHSITPKAGLLSMVAGKIVGVPIRMHTFTGLVFPSKTGFLKQLLILMDKLLCYCATNVYPEGNGVKNDLTDYRITSKPLNVLANGNINGVDLNYFDSQLMDEDQKNHLRSVNEIQANDYVFVFVGRLVGDKGINEIVRAFSSLNNEHFKLILVGEFETELDPLIPETLEQLKSNKKIISVGFQEDVRPFFAVSDCLVFPSYREGFPNVVLQAGAMGLPSIVTNINGCNEIIVEGVNGTIIPTKDVEALQSAMKKMATDTDWYNSLKKNAREMIASRFEHQVVWDTLLAEYNHLLKEKGLI